MFYTLWWREMKEKKLSTLNEYYELLLSMEEEAKELFKKQSSQAQKNKLTALNSFFREEAVFKCGIYEDVANKMVYEGYIFQEWDRVETSGTSLYVYRIVKKSREALSIKENCYTHIWCKYIPIMKKSLFWNYFSSKEPFMKDCSIQIIYDIIENYKKEHKKELKLSL